MTARRVFIAAEVIITNHPLPHSALGMQPVFPYTAEP
jgi:hypothetical protein